LPILGISPRNLAIKTGSPMAGCCLGDPVLAVKAERSLAGQSIVIHSPNYLSSIIELLQIMLYIFQLLFLETTTMLH